MPTWKEGDKVRVVTRDVTSEDRRTGRYFDHMAGITGTVQNVYSKDEIAVMADIDSLPRIASDVQEEATKRMREKFLGSISEEAKSQLTSEELKFNIHYMMLVRGEDLEKV